MNTATANSDHSRNPLVVPTFSEALRFWVKLGFINFGGPTGQIAIMHHELVEKKRWIDPDHFLHALNFCMLLPGPEATQLAIYIGWLLHRTWGGIVAGVFFVLPSVVILWVLSWVYVRFGTLPWIIAIFDGLKPAVLAIVIAAGTRVARTALGNQAKRLLAIAAFVSLFFFKLPFPVLILAAALVGILASRHFSEGTEDPPQGSNREIPPKNADSGGSSWRRFFVVTSVGMILWFAPLMLIGAVLGARHTVFREGLFFSGAAMVTFGGAYAVLPYVSQLAVERHGWLSAAQMLDGLGLAETTPGPLIMVLQFVGFLGGWNHPGNLQPLAAATLGALITTWTTFVPCFLWIFLGAPRIEALRRHRAMKAMLSAVTASVVGVILNLAVWFGIHLLFPGGDSGHFNGFAAAMSTIALIGMLRWNWNIIAVIFAAGVLGWIHHLF
jgi:chromate transporter